MIDVFTYEFMRNSYINASKIGPLKFVRTLLKQHSESISTGKKGDHSLESLQFYDLI